MGGLSYPETPDGRYFVAKGLLWRKSAPSLCEEERKAAVEDLMRARRDVSAAKKSVDATAERESREAVDAAKRRLGERGPVWWTDGAPDEGGKAPSNSSYAEWWRTLTEAERQSGL